MGRTFHFECPRCQYRARVAGGADSGLHCSIITIVCIDCRQLYDVFTRVRQRSEQDFAARGRRRPQLQTAGLTIPPLVIDDNPMREFSPSHRAKDGAARWRWTTVKPRCPNVTGHRIEEWKHPGLCPRCGVFMEKNGFPYRLWD